jgi:hypothetical protein
MRGARPRNCRANTIRALHSRARGSAWVTRAHRAALSFLEDCGALVKARIAIRAVTRDGDDALGEGVRRRLFAESANVVKPRDIQCRQVRVMTFRMVALKFVLETCLYVIRLAFP